MTFFREDYLQAASHQHFEGPEILLLNVAIGLLGFESTAAADDFK